MRGPRIQIEYPAWVAECVDFDRFYDGDEARMGVAIAVARENVARGTGGPFGAAIFERRSGKLVAVGMNAVVRLSNCTLHGEMVAFMMANRRLDSFTLGAPGMPEHELHTSCEPCAMCLGATLWSGVRRLACAAGREDATRLHFEEGPVFPESYSYLESRGIEIARGIRRPDAVEVMEEYRRSGGVVYNGGDYRL